MQQRDLDDADRVHRIAFGTRFGLASPSQFRSDAQVVRTRWATDPSTTFVAEHDGTIVGAAIGMDWGSVFVVGPIMVHPDHAGRGIARLLTQTLVALADARAKKLLVLFTFPESATHIRLYESYGFAPQMLTPIMSKPVAAGAHNTGRLYTKLSPLEQTAVLAGCRAISNAVFDGLDLSREIRAIATDRLGDSILLDDRDSIAGFALCHFGRGTEAGSGNLLVKFAAVRPGDALAFEHLLDRCEAMASAIGATQIITGVNTGRAAAYRLMQARGYRAGLIGVAMHRPNTPGYNRTDVFAIDDWR